MIPSFVFFWDFALCDYVCVCVSCDFSPGSLLLPPIPVCFYSMLLYYFIIIFLIPVCILMREKGYDLSERGVRKDLEEVGGEEPKSKHM